MLQAWTGRTRGPCFLLKPAPHSTHIELSAISFAGLSHWLKPTAKAARNAGLGGRTKGQVRQIPSRVVPPPPKGPLDFAHAASTLNLWQVGFRFSQIETSEVIEPAHRDLEGEGQQRESLSRRDLLGRGPSGEPADFCHRWPRQRFNPAFCGPSNSLFLLRISVSPPHRRSCQLLSGRDRVDACATGGSSPYPKRSMRAGGSKYFVAGCTIWQRTCTKRSQAARPEGQGVKGVHAQAWLPRRGGGVATRRGRPRLVRLIHGIRGEACTTSRPGSNPW